jgi:hypothetical protein
MEAAWPRAAVGVKFISTNGESTGPNILSAAKWRRFGCGCVFCCFRGWTSNGVAFLGQRKLLINENYCFCWSVFANLASTVGLDLPTMIAGRRND